MTYIVALTGGISSGKSTVAHAFKQLKVPIIDADVIARQVVAKGSPALSHIVHHFGSQILNQDEDLNRAALREIIFTYSDKKQWLNHLLHPLIQQETQRQIAAVESPYLLWVVPLLIENHLVSQANRVLLVDIEPEIQLSRLLARDEISRELAEQMLASQASRTERLAYADDIIDNAGIPENILPHVASLHQRYITLAAASQQDLHYE